MPIGFGDRMVRVVTVLADDLSLSAMRGRDFVSRPFGYAVTLLSDNADIAAEDLLGTAASVRLEFKSGFTRHFHGLVSQFTYAGLDNDEDGSLDKHQYFLELRPWFWFLRRAADIRIFQEKTAEDIIKDIFGKYGSVASFRFDVSRSLPIREYCVQYRESDFNFVSRLLEAEGLFYYFEHTEDDHKMVIGDAASVYGTIGDYETVPFFPKAERARRQRDHVEAWKAISRVRSGKYVHTAFDFKKPAADLETMLAIANGHELDDGEVYDYPGPHLTVGDGDKAAQLRMEELAATFGHVEGEGDAAGLAAGHVFGLTGFPRDDQNRDYVVLRIDHAISAAAYASGTEADEDFYRCRFVAMPSEVPFRPARRTRVPVVDGPQTAMVTGPSGEEIWTDEHGRVKVQFHWDRLGQEDEKTTCFIRVSQEWAGAGFGSIHIPRIGQEVIVDFLEGDPDRPIITGRVYNGANKPPYGLPGSMNMSGIKSNSTKGGGGFNEMMMDDTKGEELLRIQAQKNETIIVLNDKDETVHHDEVILIKNDRTEDVGHDETMSVVNNRTRKVGVNEQVTVGANQTISVGANRSDSVGANESRTVAAAQQQSVGAARNVSVGAAQAHEIGAADSWAIGAAQTIAIGAAQSLSVGKDRSTSIGDNDSLDVGKDMSTKVGKTLVIDAGDEITIKTGKASIVMKKDGTITIKGKDIKLDGSGKIDVTAKGNITQKGAKILQN